MRFTELHETVPYARFGKEKSLRMSPYKGITLAMPGRHAEDCSPKGGDFVVMVTDTNIKWRSHQFTHDDIFFDVEVKAAADPVLTNQLMMDYKAIIADNAMTIGWLQHLPGIDPTLFLEAVQCLAVAEHRRYAHYEDRFGGRFLPFRFAAGIAEGLWTADECVKVQKYGRPAVERLEKTQVPLLTQTLMA